jgi:hypothetical protein
MILACTANTADQDTTNTLVTVTSLQANNTDELFSDVCIVNEDTGGCTVTNDSGTVTILARAKNLVPNVGVSPQYNDVVFDRYRVTYTRADGRGVNGVDVPYPFDGVMNLYVPIGDDASGSFTLVRHAAKVEPPLISLTDVGGASILTTLARVDFYGRDTAGRAISVTGYITVTFADFPDE